jgi:hypothetical protein
MLLTFTTLSICALACTKKDDAGTTSTTAAAAPAAAPASGCGSDWADPQKEFCVKLPPGFTAGKSDPPSALYSELITFRDEKGVEFTVTVGFSSTNWKSYTDELTAEEKWLGESKDIKMGTSGETAGEGKWWIFKNGGYDSVISLTKSNGDKAIKCSGDDGTPGVDACKSIRAYPK